MFLAIGELKSLLATSGTFLYIYSRTTPPEGMLASNFVAYII
jgi:hypothetical protein